MIKKVVKATALVFVDRLRKLNKEMRKKRTQNVLFTTKKKIDLLGTSVFSLSIFSKNLLYLNQVNATQPIVRIPLYLYSWVEEDVPEHGCATVVNGPSLPCMDSKHKPCFPENESWKKNFEFKDSLVTDQTSIQHIAVIEMTRDKITALINVDEKSELYINTIQSILIMLGIDSVYRIATEPQYRNILEYFYIRNIWDNNIEKGNLGKSVKNVSPNYPLGVASLETKIHNHCMAFSPR